MAVKMSRFFIVGARSPLEPPLSRSQTEAGNRFLSRPSRHLLNVIVRNSNAQLNIFYTAVRFIDPDPVPTKTKCRPPPFVCCLLILTGVRIAHRTNWKALESDPEPTGVAQCCWIVHGHAQGCWIGFNGEILCCRPCVGSVGSAIYRSVSIRSTIAK